jgi:nicotinamidase/pyrazinamidase
MAVYDGTTALLVVDVQNDFADPSGALYVSGGGSVVPVVNYEIAVARAAGASVFYTQDWHPPSTPHFAKDGGVWPVHCVAGSWGAELHPDLVVSGPVIRKGSGGEDGYSGFAMRHPVSGATSDTELDRLLREAGAKRLVVVGLATDYCVQATALDARLRGYPTTVLAAGIRAVELAAGDGARAIEAMRRAGVEVVDAPAAGTPRPARLEPAAGTAPSSEAAPSSESAADTEEGGPVATTAADATGADASIGRAAKAETITWRLRPLEFATVETTRAPIGH